MENSLVTEMTLKVRLTNEITEELMKKENIERAEKLVGYKMFNADGTLTEEAIQGQFDDTYGVIHTLLESEEIEIIDCTYDKVQLNK